MAEINLGKVVGERGTSVRYRGKWAADSSYVNSESYIDMVTHGGNMWMCLADNVNVEPGTDETKWELSVKGASGNSFEVVNNLTTEAEGYILDARQGKVLKDTVDKIYTDKLKTLDEIAQVEEEGKFVDAMAVRDLNNNVTPEVGTLTLGAVTGCTAEGMNGYYVRLANMVFFTAELNGIANNGSSDSVSVSFQCLPYKTKKHTVFTTGYQNVTIRTSGTETDSIVKAGAYGESDVIYLLSTFYGRTYDCKQVDITSGGSLIISGFYQVADGE